MSQIGNETKLYSSKESKSGTWEIIYNSDLDHVTLQYFVGAGRERLESWIEFNKEEFLELQEFIKNMKLNKNIKIKIYHKQLSITKKTMRKIQIIGNVIRDAEVRSISADRSVINFDVAVNERWKDRSGVKQERVHYIKCALWREQTGVAQFLTKGVKLFIEGTPEVDCYVNKEGKAVGSVKINVRELEFLGGGNKNQQQNSGHQNSEPAQDFGSESLAPNANDDLPF